MRFGIWFFFFISRLVLETIGFLCLSKCGWERVISGGGGNFFFKLFLNIPFINLINEREKKNVNFLLWFEGFYYFIRWYRQTINIIPVETSCFLFFFLYKLLINGEHLHIEMVTLTQNVGTFQFNSLHFTLNWFGCDRKLSMCIKLKNAIDRCCNLFTCYRHLNMQT